MPRARVRARCSCATRGRRSTPRCGCGCASKAPAGYFAAFPLETAMDGIMTVGEVVESRADGFAPGDTVWHASGWRDYAVVEAGEARARRRRHADAARRRRRPTAGVSRRARRQRAHRVRRPLPRRRPARGRRRLGLRRRRRGREPRRADGEAPRPPRDRQRRLRRESARTCSTSSASTPRSTTSRARCRSCCARRRPTASTSTSTTSAATTSRRRSARCGVHGRVAICGAISEYDAAEPPPGPSNLFLTVANDLDDPRLPRQQQRRPPAGDDARGRRAGYAKGALRYRETIVDGLEHAPEALAGLMRGDNTGKTLVQIARRARRRTRASARRRGVPHVPRRRARPRT